ncbi:MAG: single-stranded-DNA-specific exonuclease RecJ, partial [Pseudomonadota bacterium]
GARLIVTVDSGTRAAEGIARAKGFGIDVVVTDHHEAKGELPSAHAIVNPQRLAGYSPHRELSGCGVAFMLALALRKKLRNDGKLPSPEPNLKRQLDLVALGTIADVVPLSGANRILVRHGLGEIADARRPGIAALIEVSSTNTGEMNPDSIAFQLAPRLNAAGRLGSAHEALDLLMCDDPSRSLEIARSLDRANRERQRVEGVILEEAYAMLSARGSTGQSSVVLSSDGWHVGVIGIVASKIARRAGIPAVVISRDSKPARGSARSIDGINLVEALSECGDLLVRYGGHTMAAGLSINEDRIDEFSARLDGICRKMLPIGALHHLLIDAEVMPSEINGELIAELSNLKPFGAGNPEPLLAMRGASVLSRRILGQKHLKLRVGSGGFGFDAIGFNMAGDLLEDQKNISLAFTPELNTWNGTTSVQLKIKDIKVDNR